MLTMATFKGIASEQCGLAFTVRSYSAFAWFLPSEVEAVVSEEAQCVLQPGEEKEIREVDPAKHSEVLHVFVTPKRRKR